MTPYTASSFFFVAYLYNSHNYQTINSVRSGQIFKNLTNVLGTDSGRQTDNSVILYPRRTVIFYQEILKAKQTIMLCSVLEFCRRFRVKYCVYFHYTGMSVKAKRLNICPDFFILSIVRQAFDLTVHHSFNH
jgi:hypothetical protein